MEETERVCLGLGMYKQESVIVPLPSVFRHSDKEKHEVVLVFSKSPSFVAAPVVTESIEKSSATYKPQDANLDRARRIKKAVADADAKKVCLEEAHYMVKSTREESDKLYRDGVIRFSGSDKERLFGSWNNYLLAAGVSVNREYNSPEENVLEYINFCKEKGRYMSFYKFGTEVGSNPKMQRLK